MGETRDPKLGVWSVFEGDRYVTGITESARGHVNYPVVWPVTFRFLRLTDDRMMESVSVVIDEALNVTSTKEELDLTLDEEPYFSSEAQETFLFECRVYAVKPTICVKEGSEGIYLGRTRHGALIGWDTPSGEPYKESVHFDSIRNLYR